MRFLLEGLNPFKIQSRFNLVFNSEFYNSNYREILELDQKGKLCNLKFLSACQVWIILGKRKAVFCIFKLGALKLIGKSLGTLKGI
jgi:hypothetical protein